MGLLEALLGADNPAAQWANKNTNWLGSIGAGLGAPGSVADKLGAAAQYAPAGRAADASAQEKLTATNQTKAWLHAQGFDDLVPLVDAGQGAIALTTAIQRKTAAANGGTTDLSSTAQGRQQLAQQYGLQGDALNEYVLTGKLPGGNQTVRAGVGQPIYGKNRKSGAVEPWQSMTDGTMVNIANPNANPADYDFNPGIAASERTGAQFDAKTSAAARAALPGAEQAVAITDKAVQTILDDPAAMQEHFGKFLGVIPQQMIPLTVPGTKKAQFDVNMEQLTGQAFMQARQMLRGGGQITDFEGRRAEAAYSKAEAAAASGDQQQFLTAVQEFQQAVHEGFAKLQAAAQGSYAADQPAVTGSTGGGKTYTYNPATGELE